MSDWRYAVSQGPCYLWWILRDEFFDAAFKTNLVCTLVGVQPYRTRSLEWLSCLALPALYNYVRSPCRDFKWYDVILGPVMVFSHLVCIQFVHIWATLTPREDVDNTPAGERGVDKSRASAHRDVSFYCWIGLWIAAAFKLAGGALEECWPCYS